MGYPPVYREASHAEPQDRWSKGPEAPERQEFICG